MADVRPVEVDGWERGRWWRVLDPDGSLWCETSNEAEARAAMAPDRKLQKLYQRTEHLWIDILHVVPEEPPVGTTLVDSDGDPWTRDETGWHCHAETEDEPPESWNDVLRYGPMTKPDPALGGLSAAWCTMSG